MKFSSKKKKSVKYLLNETICDQNSMFCLHQKKSYFTYNYSSNVIIFSAGTISDQYIMVKEKLFHIKLSKNETICGPICHWKIEKWNDYPNFKNKK